MNPRNDDCCEITSTMWKKAASCSEEINKGFSGLVNDCSKDNTCLPLLCALSCIQPEIPVGFCATWLLCCSTPLSAALICTPVTALVDCGIFSYKTMKNGCDTLPVAPPRQVMESSEYCLESDTKYSRI